MKRRGGESEEEELLSRYCSKGSIEAKMRRFIEPKGKASLYLIPQYRARLRF